MTDMPRRLLNPTVIVAMVVGLILGAAGSWWINRPAPSWLTFNRLEAFYTLGDVQITTDGSYSVTRECEPDDLVIWRYEAIATDGQIAIYGPRPPPPSFTEGEHKYTGSIPLLQKINPDGWVVRILITCPGESPETIASPPAKVQIVRK